MSSPPASPFRRLWYRWKSLNLPWRRQRLCGYDLFGNTFWEFRDALNSNRFRRIAKYPSSTHYSEVAISPSWIQWLRHTREHAPTVREQQLDVQRQVDIKQLAAQADERWKSQERFADAPKRRTLGDGTGTETVPMDKGAYVGGEGEASGSGTGGNAVEGGVSSVARGAPGTSRVNEKEKESPWDKHKRQNPGDGWQPEAWQPGPMRR